MINEFGKVLRKLRIDEDERLQHMSKRIGKSSAFISAVERGDKSPPSGFEENIIKAYGLVGQAAEALRVAADDARKSFTIEPKTKLERDAVGLMARRVNSNVDSFSEEELKKLLSVLRREDGQNDP